MQKFSSKKESLYDRIKHFFFGNPRNINDPHLSQKLSLVAFLAWVGLGVDGLSSSAYGPEEAFRALGEHTYLAVVLAFATAFTVCVISFAYSKLIEHFPHGGGGYVVTTQNLGKSAGIVSGAALLIDYILTITVSIAGGGDAIFSLLPIDYQVLKLPIEASAIFLLVALNIRGLKESVTLLVPFFLLFIVTHIILIGGGIWTHAQDLPVVVSNINTGFQSGIKEVGLLGLALIFLKAFSLGGGTYTGIEAISNGVATLRKPRVKTAKVAMIYLSVSLAITAGGLLICYLLFGVSPVEGETLNATLAKNFAGSFNYLGIPIGSGFVALTLLSESILLFIAAQTGFIDGPRIMANMAVDNWLPKKFATLSDRLTIKNGILILGIAAMALLVFTKGKIGILVVMYSINVFLTFTLSQLSMMKYWFVNRSSKRDEWKWNILIHSTAFMLCGFILLVMIIEKFLQGAWVTLLITSVCVLFCVLIRKHYLGVKNRISTIEARIKLAISGQLKEELNAQNAIKTSTPNLSDPTAIVFVSGYSGLGTRSILTIMKEFPNTFKNFIFVTVGVINSEFFKEGRIEDLKVQTENSLKQYLKIAERLGVYSTYEYKIGTDVVHEASTLCFEISQKYPNATFFAGEIIFEKPGLFSRILHNQTAYAIQREISSQGLTMVILPLVLWEKE